MHWIQKIPYLTGKYKLADVVKLALNQTQVNYEDIASLIRTFALRDDQNLIRYFISQLVQSKQFILAVRYAKEFIDGFLELNNSASNEAKNVSEKDWTPRALIYAMFRAKKYSAVLTYSKEFKIEVYPPLTVVQGLISEKLWVEAFLNVKAYKLEDHVSSAFLVNEMLNSEEWSHAIRSVNSGGKSLQLQFSKTVLVERMMKVGDFLSALKYIKELHLIPSVENFNINPTELEHSRPLLRKMIDSMIRFKEFYKAIKYAIKFNLISEEKYSIRSLVKLAIESQQYHVALLYVEKLGLQSDFLFELEAIRTGMSRKAEEFLKLLKSMGEYFHSENFQSKLRSLENNEGDYETIVVDIKEQEISDEEVKQIKLQQKSIRHQSNYEEPPDARENTTTIFDGHLKNGNLQNPCNLPQMPPPPPLPPQPSTVPHKNPFVINNARSQAHSPATNGMSGIDLSSLTMQFHLPTNPSNFSQNFRSPPLPPPPPPSFQYSFPISHPINKNKK